MKTLATGPVIQNGPNGNPYRIVLRAAIHNGMIREFVVHHEVWEGDNSSYFWGNYFTVNNNSRAHAMDCFQKALAFFHKKCAEVYAEIDYDTLLNGIMSRE